MELCTYDEAAEGWLKYFVSKEFIKYGKSIPLFHKKIIKKKTSSAEQRKAKHKKSTKAELKKEVLNHCSKATEHIHIFNRISMVNEKTTHLNAAIIHLKNASPTDLAITCSATK